MKIKSMIIGILMTGLMAMPVNGQSIECEVCERTGTELEIWYDTNNIKHYTCKERCTGGLDVLYGE